MAKGNVLVKRGESLIFNHNVFNMFYNSISSFYFD